MHCNLGCAPALALGLAQRAKNYIVSLVVIADATIGALLD